MKQRKEDPKRIAARKERDRAGTWLEVVCKGTAEFLKEISWRYPEDLRESLEYPLSRLDEAIDEAEHAWKAFEPYWRYTRRRVGIRARRRSGQAAHPRKKAKTKVQKES